MGRDIAGRKDRDGRMSGSQAQLVGGDHALRIGEQLLQIRIGSFVPLSRPRRTGISDLGLVAAAGQTITRTTDEANLFIH